MAHGSEAHGKNAAAAEQMKKLHAIMPQFSAASAQLEAALEKSDVAAARIQADRIVAAIPAEKIKTP